MASCYQIVCCVTVILIVWLSSIVAGEDACSTGLCKCSHGKAECSRLNLTYIPALPVYINLLKFEYNYIQHITAASLSNLTNLRLVRLFMKHNHVRTIDRNAFCNLTRLKTVDLSNNFLSSDALYSVFISRSNPITGLYFSWNQVTEIPSDLLGNIKSLTLGMFDLSYNNITSVNLTILRPIDHIGNFKLGGNRIASLILDHGPRITRMYLSNNQITKMPNFCFWPIAFEKLQYLTLANNLMSSFYPEFLSCMKNLKILDMSMNVISSLGTDSFRALSSLVELFMVRQGNKNMFQIAARAFNNSYLERLHLNHNTLTTANIDPDAFSGCHNLNFLSLNTNAFYANTDKLNTVLSPLLSLQVLNLYRTHMKTIPDVIGTRLHKLTKLYVDLNLIETWRPDAFLNNTQLRELHLYQNRFSTVTRQMFPDYLRKQLTTIDLGMNPFECNCDIVWFIQWMREEPTKFNSYPYDYKCLNITERICLKNTAAFLSLTTVTCLLVIVLLLTSMVYKYRWSIKYHIYMWRYRPLKMLDIAKKHFMYDAFVSYCIEDSDWVLDKLQPIMEDGDNLKLCIHQRDFEGGKLIIDNIIHHMENSRKVLIVLSNDFAKSEWCQFEMSLAQKLVLDMSIESLVVVLLEEIDAANMSKSLNALFKTTTYITWDKDGEEVLWLRLKESLKKRDLDDHALL